MSTGQRASFANEANAEPLFSPTPSQTSNGAAAAGIPYDSVSSASRRSIAASESPVTAMTSLSEQADAQAEPRLSAHRKSAPVERRSQVDVRLRSGTSNASAFGSASKRGSSSGRGKPYFDVAKAIFYQADTDHDGLINREEFRNWARPGIVYPDGRSTPMR